MAAMHRWADARRQDSQGVSTEDLDAFAKWMDERSASQRRPHRWRSLARHPLHRSLGSRTAVIRGPLTVIAARACWQRAVLATYAILSVRDVCRDQRRTSG